MNNKMLAALAGVVLIGLALLLWNLRSGDSNASQGANPAKAATGAGAGGGSGGSGSGRSGATGSAGSEAPSVKNDTPEALPEEERLSIDMEHLLKGEVPRRVRAAASTCYNPSAVSYKELEEDESTIDIDFTLVLKSGTFNLNNVKLVSGIGKPLLEECIVEEVGKVTWTDAVNADFSQEFSDSISRLALMKFSQPLPHELEEEPEDPANADFGRKRMPHEIP